MPTDCSRPSSKVSSLKAPWPTWVVLWQHPIPALLQGVKCPLLSSLPACFLQQQIQRPRGGPSTLPALRGEGGWIKAPATQPPRGWSEGVSLQLLEVPGGTEPRAPQRQTLSSPCACLPALCCALHILTGLLEAAPDELPAPQLFSQGLPWGYAPHDRGPPHLTSKVLPPCALWIPWARPRPVKTVSILVKSGSYRPCVPATETVPRQTEGY